MPAMLEPDASPDSIFGPHLAGEEVPGAPGEDVQLRIHLGGCNGLPRRMAPLPGDCGIASRRSFRVGFCSISKYLGDTYIDSSATQEGEKWLRCTVQWDEVLVITYTGYWVHWHTFKAYQHLIGHQPPQTCSVQVNMLIATMMATVNAILHEPHSCHVHQRGECVSAFLSELGLASMTIHGLVTGKSTEERGSQDRATELARLCCIIVTPEPTVGADTKDALLLVLDGISQSSDAFPPLKSAASGLLFFAACADLASSNKKQIRDIYKQIETLAISLKRGVRDGTPISSEQQDAIAALAQDIAMLNEDVRDIVNERKSRFKRFFGAKRHREELQDVVARLEMARSTYTTTLATLNATTNAQVLAHVRALTLVMNVSPVYAAGSRCADTSAFPAVLPRFEQPRAESA
ncbi:unnamed protein product [Peniophora sp. CBMAI 1063]|nr:unnamed protein product [Peniophora sp. CBMAI 1063]